MDLLGGEKAGGKKEDLIRGGGVHIRNGIYIPWGGGGGGKGTLFKRAGVAYWLVTQRSGGKGETGRELRS